MNVFLTVDIETYTGDYDRDVFGYGKGLDFILETLNYFGIKATFFVEALGATRWGIEPLKKVCSTIKKTEHDIQLHVHPKVAKISGINIKNDKLRTYDKEIQKELIKIGLAKLVQCGAKNIVAFRAGDLAADKNTLTAMEEAGLFISSNRDLDQKSSIHTKINDHFPVKNDLSKKGNIVDLPVTCFRSSLPFWDGQYRHFEICAMGTKEMISAVSKMLKTEYSCATILTHPGEFFRLTKKGTVFIKKNCSRLRKLLKFLKSNKDITNNTISQCLESCIIPETSSPEIMLNPLFSIMRVFAQVNDRILGRVR